jgi:hypothetical protein
VVSGEWITPFADPSEQVWRQILSSHVQPHDSVGQGITLEHRNLGRGERGGGGEDGGYKREGMIAQSLCTISPHSEKSPSYSWSYQAVNGTRDLPHGSPLLQTQQQCPGCAPRQRATKKLENKCKIRVLWKFRTFIQSFVPDLLLGLKVCRWAKPKDNLWVSSLMKTQPTHYRCCSINICLQFMENKFPNFKHGIPIHDHAPFNRVYQVHKFALVLCVVPYVTVLYL